MVIATIIISTYDHADLLHYSINSVLKQSIPHFELMVIGDGAPERTDNIMADWCQKDNRIKYFPNPKGAGIGELYRHQILQNAQGKYIFYLGDDDLWMPDHIENMLPFLKSFDFVNTCHTSIAPDGEISFLEHQLREERIKTKLLTEHWNFFGPTCVAHSLEAYHKLPFGWRPRPEGIWGDLYMWRQWIEANKFTFFSIPMSTTLHFPSPLRAHMTLAEREFELNDYSIKLKEESIIYHIRSLFELSGSDNILLQKTYVEGLLSTIKNIQFESNKCAQTLKEKEIFLNVLSSDLNRWKKDYKDLKEAWSTKLGFSLSYPFRILYELLKKERKSPKIMD